MNIFEKAVLIVLALVIAFEAGRQESARPVRPRRDSRESRQPSHRQATHQRFTF